MSTKLNKVLPSHLVLENQSTEQRGKYDSDAMGDTLGTGSFTAYGVQIVSVLTPDEGEVTGNPRTSLRGGANRSLLPCGGLIHILPLFLPSFCVAVLFVLSFSENGVWLSSDT